MRSQLRGSLVAVGAAVVAATLWSTSHSVLGQGLQSPMQSPITYKAPRTAYGQPDLNGFWQALNTANWDLEEHGPAPSPYPTLLGVYLAQPPGLGVVDGGTIPYKPEALAKRNKLRENRLKTDPFLHANPAPDEDLADPEAKCFRGGVPRATSMPYPFQILQTRNRILFAYEYAWSPRIVYLDKTRDDLLEIDSWNGQSIGRWEGETLVVDVRWFSGWTIWLDRAGNFMSKEAVVTERFTPISPYHLLYEATIEDPNVFTRPWKLSMPLYRRIEPNMQLLEFQCIPFAEEFMYGKLKKQPEK